MAALINRTRNFAACRRFLQFSKKQPLHKCISSDTKLVSVSEALNSTELIGSNVKIKGWIKAARKQKELVFLHVNDGKCPQRIQVLIPSKLVEPDCGFNAAVEIIGTVKNSPKEQQAVEIQATELKVLGSSELKDFPFAPRKVYLSDYIRKFLHLRPKTNVQSSILRLSSQITTSLHSTLIEDGYIHTFTPILTTNDCEGAGEVFLVKHASSASKNESYFNEEVYLTVSGQLHLEALAGGLSKVYTIGPTFRAENSRSRRHLAEFRMLEAELAFCDNLEPLLTIMEKLVKRTALKLLEEGKDDLSILNKFYDENIEASLEKIMEKPFQTLSYYEAIDVLLKNKDQFKTPPKGGDDLGAEHELFLVEHMGGPTFIVEWPSSIKPFYMRTTDESEDVVSCVDLLVPRVGELCGGSLREHRYELLKKRLEMSKLDESLSWYLDLRKYGGSPTGGFGMGVERLVSFLLKVPNIKDVVAFPRTPHNCLM